MDNKAYKYAKWCLRSKYVPKYVKKQCKEFIKIANGKDKKYYLNEEKVKQIFNDKECGNIFRIKGFMQTKSDQWIELNATHQNITIQPIKEGQEIFIVIGEKLNKEKITTNLMD